MAAANHPVLEREHGDITYLKQDEIGLVLSKALSETYKAQPNDPVDFFAKFLLNHTRTAKLAREVGNGHLIISIGARRGTHGQGGPREAPASTQGEGGARGP